jgi:hypothetical protein
MGMNQPFFKNTQQHQMLFLATPLIKYSYQPFAEAIEQLVVWFTPEIPALRRRKQENCEFKGCPGYIISETLSQTKPKLMSHEQEGMCINF